MSWTTDNLGSFCRLVNGKAFKADDWSESGWPIIRIQNLNDVTKPFNHWNGGLDRQVHVQNGDLLIAWSGTPGTSFGAHIWDGPEGVLNQHIFRVDLTNGDVTKEWLKFSVNTQLLRLIDQAHGGVGLKHVTKGAVESVQIPLPPLPEQKRIAAILDAADALRAKRRESLAQLDTLLQSTFLDLFGDPVTNPMGWDLLRLPDLVSSEKHSLKRGPFGGALKKEIFVPDGFKVYEQKHVIYEDFEAGEYFIDEHDCARLGAFKVNPGDLLVSCSGTIGRIAIVPKGAIAGVMNQALLKIRLTESKMLNPFFVSLWRSQPFERQVLGMTHGTGMKNMKSMKELKSIDFITPPLDLQHRFATLVESVEQQKARLHTHLAELDALFASLQSRAFNGEL